MKKNQNPGAVNSTILENPSFSIAPKTMSPIEITACTMKPMIGTIDQENVVYLARGAEHIGSAPDINEAAQIGWIPLAEVRRRIADGSIIGAGSVSGLLAVLLLKAEGKL